MTCQDVLHEVSVCVLRGDPFPAAVTEHLQQCSSCEREAADLSTMRVVLDDAGPIEPVSHPDEVALQRLLSAARQETRVRRQRQWVIGAAAAVVAVLLAVGTGVVVHQRTQQGFTPITAAAVSAATGVSGTVRVSAADSGTDLGLAVKGVSPGTRCTLVVVDSSGGRHVVSWWRASYSGTASMTAHTDVSPEDVWMVELMNAGTGQTLLSMSTT